MKKLITLIFSFVAAVSICNAQNYTSQRPAPEDRLFVSKAVDAKIEEVASMLTNEKLAWMFSNCYPNTLDTTIHPNGENDTFVYTGDIHAMWLRDSGAQVWPYLQLINEDEDLRKLLAGVIHRQFKCICIDPYANAFYKEPDKLGEWKSDYTRMQPGTHERKWEIDSHCYPIRLAYEYWKISGDSSVFSDVWLQSIQLTLQTFREQQRKENLGPYRFMRRTERPFDTMSNDGFGAPVKPVGLIASAFRPSDDATIFQFLVPSNFFAVTSLRKAAEILTEVNDRQDLAQQCLELAAEVEEALKKYAVYDHPEFGPIYAYEVDGFGNQLLMDDANVPSLLAMPYLGDVDVNDPIYQNTRRFVWSENNPYFFRGKAGEGIGGPHIGYYYAWPMSIMMKAFTSQNDEEIKWCIEMLMNTDAGTGFMHESFYVNNPQRFTRKWFAWQNGLFGELILKLIKDGKLDLLNSIKTRTVAVLGDSYSTFADYIPEGNATWYSAKPQGENDVVKVEDTWWHQFCQKNGYELVRNESWSGSTICNTGYDGAACPTWSFIARMKNIVEGENDPDLILVFGGTNDSWANSPIGKLKFSGWKEKDLKSYLPACCYMLDYLTKEAPESKIICIINSELKPEITQGQIDACNHYGAYPLLLEDIEKIWGHPSVKGMTAISDQLSTFVYDLR